MNKEIVEMAEYVCDHICPMPEKMFDQEKLEAYCNDKCNVVLCAECVHACKLPSGNISCGNIRGIDSTKLGSYDGCSHGKRCTTQIHEK